MMNYLDGYCMQFQMINWSLLDVIQINVVKEILLVLVLEGQPVGVEKGNDVLYNKLMQNPKMVFYWKVLNIYSAGENKNK